MRLPYVREWRRVYLQHPNPGHFYSPVPDPESAKELANKKRHQKLLHGLSLNEDKQRALAANIRQVNAEFEKFLLSESLSYVRSNIYYANSDALTLYGLIKISMPRRIIEIGSGTLRH